MTDKDFFFLERLYKEAKRLRYEIDNCEENDKEYLAHLKKEYDELDVIDAMVNNTSQKVKKISERIIRIRNEVLRRTNGVVNLDDETIVSIIEKSVI